MSIVSSRQAIHFGCVVLIALMFASGCTALPAVVDAESPQAVRHSSDTYLARTMASAAKGQREGDSGLFILDSGTQAFLQRAALIEAAERTIDAQYYIWNSDVSGLYLARRLLLAADRGVRVRLLLDDMNVAGRDAVLALLDQHPNIEIRIYNPSTVREGQGKWVAFFADFERMNRRMHNKTFVVDGAAGIAGGRNIGDEYFDLHKEVNFRDRDVLAAGPVVSGLAANFSAYWRSQWSIPISQMASSPSAEDYQQAAEKARALAGDTSGLHARPPQNSQEADAALAQTVKDFTWAPAELIFDPPMEKADAATDQPKQTARALRKLVDNTETEILVESAYFILAGEQLDVVQGLRERGVRVAAITNSLASNDLVSNHAGYARWRMAMLAKGLELHELRTDAEACKTWIANPNFCAKGAMSLHAKSAVFDRKTVFIGSFNVNLRSIYLNGETVLIIHSAELAERVAKDIDAAMAPANSWQLSLHEGKRIIWSAGDQAWSTEPETDWWRRVKSGFFATLPVEKYL